jgi:hypothetical protein
MKSLNDIDAHIASAGEKRIPLSAAGKITAPGSYYLTKDINAPNGVSGIQLSASNVTIDLNGFSIIGQGTSGTPAGVNVQGTQSNICVKNGTITGFGGAGISGTIDSSRFEKLIINASGVYGINMRHDNEVRDCVITHNFDGIYMQDGCRVVQSIVTGNRAYGIIGVDQTTIESCTIAGNNAVGVTVNYGSVVRNCTVRANGATGISFSGGSVIIGNLCDTNGNRGLGTDGDASRIEANTCTYNHSGGMSITGKGVNVIVRNTCRGNGPGGGVDNNYGGLQTSTTQVFGHILDMSTPGSIPDSFGPWSNISY